jgi:hypothetical protein
MKPLRILTITSVAIAALLASVLAAPAGAATPSRATAAAAVDQCGLASFDSASVLRDTTTSKLTLLVSGTKSATNVTIKLVPAIYVQQPPFWVIEVFGCSSGIGLPVLTPYTAKLDVTHTVGTIGIEVVGSNGSQQIPLFPRKDA